MKQLLGNLMNKSLSHLGKAALDIACLHQMGMSPRKRDAFFGFVDPEARFMAGAAHLKKEQEAVYPGHHSSDKTEFTSEKQTAVYSNTAHG